MFDIPTTPLQPRTLDALWTSARDMWNLVLGQFDLTLANIRHGMMTRQGHRFTSNMLRGLEHFVRRALILAAQAMQAPAPASPAKPKPAAISATPRPRRRAFSVFAPMRRMRTGPGYPRRFHPTPPEYTEEGYRFSAYQRRLDLEFKLANLTRDPPELCPPLLPALPTSGEPKRPERPRWLLPARVKVSVHSLVDRMAALQRVLTAPDAWALRVRRRLDRHRAGRASAPPRLDPWPRDDKAQRVFSYDLLLRMWPSVEADVRAALAPNTS